MKQTGDKPDVDKMPQFEAEEVAALLESYNKHSVAITGSFKDSADARLKKKRAWLAVTDAVNAVGGKQRKVGQIKKKMINLKTSTKKIVSRNKREVKKTGGGTADIKELTHNQELVLSTINDKLLDGVPGGIDLYETPTALSFTSITDVSTEPHISYCAVTFPDDADKSFERPAHVDIETCTDPSGADNIRSYSSITETVNDYDEINDLTFSSNKTAEIVLFQPSNQTCNVATTPTSKNEDASIQSNVNKKKREKRSIFTAGPQEKLMKSQIDLFEEQISIMKNIEILMAERNKIEAQKLLVMQGNNKSFNNFLQCHSLSIP